MKVLRPILTLCALTMAGCLAERPKAKVPPLVSCQDSAAFASRKAPTGARLQVDGRCLRNAKGEAFRLRGFSIADPQHITMKRSGLLPIDVINKAVEEFGANVIRIPVIPDDEDKVLGKGGSGMGFFEDPERYLSEYLDPAVEAVIARGAYAIVEPHFVADYLVELPRVLEFWRWVAPRYAKDELVIFELMNEPIGPVSWLTFRNQFALPVMDQIRQDAPDTLIIVGGPEYSVNVGPAATFPIDDPNVMYGAHIYPETGTRRWHNPLSRLARELPLMITEWGYAEDSEQPVRGTTVDFGQPFVEWMNEYELSWSAWIFDNQWGEIMFDSGWQLRGGGSHMGDLVRDQLARPAFPAERNQ